ncbi:hypothetical protein E2I00_011899 [Balaenoptera physalus]|uniref:Tbk1/Ikki binding domain-containing protein n=1 Tax=Balaenoptera physalus TaxID=9770 RepID=A0A6A1QAP4_BALPH|nr:hypothetical protein E2I00_011899 [Balaenoptera physalus]
MQSAYWELKREMSNLHLVTQVQAELLRKLKTPTAIKKGNLRPSRMHGRPWERQHKTALDEFYRNVQKTGPSLTKRQNSLSCHEMQRFYQRKQLSSHGQIMSDPFLTMAQTFRNTILMAEVL